MPFSMRTCSCRQQSSADHRTRIVQTWLAESTFELIISDQVLIEVESVLARPRLAKRIAYDDAVRFVRAIRTTADVVDDPAVIAEATRDQDDDYVVALARAHDAEVIVSGDKDLLEWDEQSPPVVTPAAFERMLVDR